MLNNEVSPRLGVQVTKLVPVETTLFTVKLMLP
jgi:hypothetical protein